MFDIIKKVDWVLLTLAAIVVTLFATTMIGSLYLLIKGAFNL